MDLATSSHCMKFPVVGYVNMWTCRSFLDSQPVITLTTWVSNGAPHSLSLLLWRSWTLGFWFGSAHLFLPPPSPLLFPSFSVGIEIIGCVPHSRYIFNPSQGCSADSAWAPSTDMDTHVWPSNLRPSNLLFHQFSGESNKEDNGHKPLLWWRPLCLMKL